MANVDASGWSDAAIVHHKAAQSGGAEFRARLARMQRGPYLDGTLLVVPSEFYSKQAVEFWQSKNFRYDGHR